ncbi:PAS domain S-box protein [Crenobacter sp. SG2305]|uniref:PAS domain S-box protein n=1 Tax=Crenobacter oryzisoli TaxID=3056844 RepID=UPI0025AAEB39|nr:PAS domain S-box protein [Crenobacter sp. SG2305]MDN0084080.1 PAS domain S-box protein [Crenobacter sp. SG2305]
MTENSFAFRLKELLEHKKLTLQAVATALGVSRPAVHKWTRGGEIDYDNLRRLAAFLNVNWIWLRYGEEAQRDLANAEPVELPMTDVRRRYTAEIMENEARMKLAQENARIVTWEWNLITDAVTYSTNVEAVYGWPIGRNEDFWPHVPDADAAMMRGVYEHSIASGEPHEIDFRIVDPAGETRWIASRATPIRDADGRIVKMVGISMDNTARKTAEEALRRSEARFRAIFENASGGIAYIGLDGRWLKANQTLCELLGYTDEELSALTFQSLTLEDDLADNLVQLDRLLAGEISMYSLEKRFRRKDGSVIWVNVKTSLQRNPDNGEPEHLVTVIDDITAQHTRVAVLEQAASEAELLFDAAGIGRWRWDAASGRVMADAVAMRLLIGQEQAGELGQAQWWRLWSAESATQLEMALGDERFSGVVQRHDGVTLRLFIARHPQQAGLWLGGVSRLDG